jgi:hypothetical protein
MLRKMVPHLLIIFVFYCTGSLCLLAQTQATSGDDAWNKVLRIKPSPSLGVDLLNGVHLNGKFVRADADNLTLRIDKAEHLVPKKDIGQIRQRSHRWLWVGVAGGIAGGVAWRVSDTKSDINKGDYFGSHTGRNLAHYWAPALGGTVLGAILDLVSHRPIYKVQNK